MLAFLACRVKPALPIITCTRYFTLCFYLITTVDLMGPYKIRIEYHGDPLILKSLYMINLTTGWFEIVRYNDKQASIIANLVQQKLLCEYKGHTIIMYDCGNKFLVHVFKRNSIKKE